MAVGPTIDATQLRWRAAQLAGRRRVLEIDVAEFHAYIARYDIDGLLAAGFTADDAAEFKRLADVHGTLAGIYFGTATQPDTYDFNDALTILRGAGGIT